MDRIDVGDFSGGEDGLHAEVGLRTRCGSNADSVVGEMDVHGVHIGFGIHGGGSHPKFLGSTNDAQGDFAPVSYENIFEHGVSAQRCPTNPGPGGGSGSFDSKQRFTKLDGCSVFYEDFQDFA